MNVFTNNIRSDAKAKGGIAGHETPSRRHQLQQLMGTRWQQQQLLQTHVENGKFPFVFCRSKASRRAKPPDRPSPSGGGQSSNHGSRGCHGLPRARVELMVAVVGGRRRRRRQFTYRTLYVFLRSTYGVPNLLVVGGQNPFGKNP